MTDRDLIEPPTEPDTSRLDSAFSRSHPEPIDIDISFFSHKSRRSTSLVGNDAVENYVKGRRTWLEFDLRDVVFITSIRVHALGYDSHHEMEFSYVPYLSDGAKTQKVTFSDGDFVFQVNDFTMGFGLRPSEPFFQTAKLTKIVVSGVEKSEITGMIRFVQNIEREKSRIEDSLSSYFTKAQKSYEEIQTNRTVIDELKATLNERLEELKDLESKVDDLSQSKKTLQEGIEVAKTVYEEQTKREEAIRQSIDKLTDDRKALTSSISQNDAQLRELKANINLFPTEIAGFVKQGTSDIKLYWKLSIIPILVIVYVTYRLFSNSEGLMDAIQNLGEITIFEFLLSRMPYVVVSATILGICYSMLKGLLSEIISINRRRQELFKISIIATDVSYASQDGMELTDEERYELRTQTKMELLKEHLRQNIGDEYTYSPRRTFIEHLKRLSPKQASTDQEAEA